ncbi:MAG: CsgG/HfaB family protein [Aquificaceae bacterium]
MNAEEYAKDVKERTLSLPHCNKPIGIITAKSFKCKAAACQGDVIRFSGFGIEVSPKGLGDGLADMLLTALSQTGCFKVVERMAIEEVKEELELMGASPKRTLKAADFIITGAVTALELKASGLGGGGIVIPLPWIGGVGIKAGKGTAHIGLDMRIVRVRDAEIISARTVEGKSERWKFGLGGGGLFGTTIGGAWFEAVKNTPLEEATRDLIAKAVTLIVNDLRNQSPDVLVGERSITYDEKGNVVKEEIVLPSQPMKSVEKKEFTQTDGLKCETLSATHYKKVLWEEDFSTCRLYPTTVKILKGQGECVELGGKKWFATTKGEVIFENTIQGFIPSKNWALEFSAYFGKSGDGSDHRIYVFPGKEGASLNLEICRYFSWSKLSGQGIPNEAGLPNDLGGQSIKIFLKKEGDLVHVFINGIRSLTVPADSVALGTLPPKIVIKMSGEDIGRGAYSMITDIKLTQE